MARLIHWFSILFMLTGVVRWEQIQAEPGRETVLDRIIHIEDTLYLSVPMVSRLCDESGYRGAKIKAGDCSLYVEQSGEGVPMILINGGPGGTHHCFHPWFAGAESFSRVIYYDQRGCGLSDFLPGPDGYSVEQAVQDLDELRKRLHIEKWVMLGYSYGGFLAQYYTTQFPENVLGLVLVGASPGMDVDMRQTRQYDFISAEERKRFRDIQEQLQELDGKKNWSDVELTRLLIYNKHLNGDWKRQNFYRPSGEQLARLALYEWVNDNRFNRIMNRSAKKTDLTGAFEECPIPVWIVEGRHDLTWGADKPGLIRRNHPHADMKFYDASAHAVHRDQTVEFFSDLENYINNLPEIDSHAMAEYKLYLEGWRKKQAGSIRAKIKDAGWGGKDSLELAAEYAPEWMDEFRKGTEFTRVGFALYDAGRYDEAATVFNRMAQFSEKTGLTSYVSFALIWEGHMLDLLSKRKDALSCYRRAEDLNVNDSWNHGQYGLKYTLISRAKQMQETPFARIENRQ